MDINKRANRMQQPAKRPHIDGFARSNTRPQLINSRPTVTTNPGVAATANETHQRAQPQEHRLIKKQFTPPPTGKTSRWKKLQLPLIISSATIVGLFLKTEAVGITAVVIYSLFAFIFRIPARTTFALAAMSMAAVTCLLLFKPDLELAGNFTTYTFLLLVTGVITLIVEGKPLKRRRRGRPGRAT